MRVHHAFRVAGGARRKKHRRHVAWLINGYFCLEPARLAGDKRLALGQHGVHRLQTGFCILAQPARVVTHQVGQVRAAAAILQHFVHLFLVFHLRKTNVGVVDGKHAFGADCGLVQRHRNRPKRLRRQNGGIQARAVGANNSHMLAAPQPRQMQPRCQYNVQAPRRSVVAGVPIDTFHWLLDHSIGFNRFVMRQLNERLGQFIAAREIDRMSNPDIRVARSLALLFNQVLFPGVGQMLSIT